MLLLCLALFESKWLSVCVGLEKAVDEDVKLNTLIGRIDGLAWAYLYLSAVLEQSGHLDFSVQISQLRQRAASYPNDRDPDVYAGAVGMLNGLQEHLAARQWELHQEKNPASREAYQRYLKKLEEEQQAPDQSDL